MTGSLVIRFDERALVVMDSERQWVFCADPLGRIVWVYTPETRFRRSRFNQWYTVKRDRWMVLHPTEASRIEEAVESWKPVWQRARHQVSESGPKLLVSALQNWIERFSEFHQEDADRFRSTYQHIPILPPDAYQSLYVQVSVGCPWNRCLFCSFYRDRDYRVLGDDELTQHLSSVRSYWEGALGGRAGIFIGDANATAVPTEVLLERLRHIREVFPEKHLDSVHSFADFFSGGRRQAEDFERLRSVGLRRICFGVESGNPELMDQIQKPVSGADVVDVVRKAKQGDIEISLIFIVGLGGRRYRDGHLSSSIELLSRLPLERPDRIYLSPLTSGSTAGYLDVADKNDWGALADEDIDNEMGRWRDAIAGTIPGLPISLYNIRRFTY